MCIYKALDIIAQLSNYLDHCRWMEPISKKDYSGPVQVLWSWHRQVGWGTPPCLHWLTHHPLCLQPTIPPPVDIPSLLDQTSKCHQQKLAKKVSQDIATLDVKSYPTFFFRKYNSIRLAEAMKRWLKELDPNIGIPPEFMTYHLRT